MREKAIYALVESEHRISIVAIGADKLVRQLADHHKVSYDQAWRTLRSYDTYRHSMGLNYDAGSQIGDDRLTESMSVPPREYYLVSPTHQEWAEETVRSSQ